MIHDRRSFIAGAGALVAAGCAPQEKPVSQAPSLKDVIVINGLGELSDPNLDSLNAGASVTKRLIDDALASGMTAVNITLGYVSGPDEPYEATNREIAEWDAIVQENAARLIKVTSTADINRAKSEGKLGLIYGFQNAKMMGDDPARVDHFASLGVKVIQLTYNPANQLGGGSVAPPDTPLTDFGRQVIDRLNATKTIVDLSHSGERTCLDAGKYSSRPIAITHTGCRALADLPRNKTDEELKLVAGKGGYVGIYFMPFLNADGRQVTGDDVVNHIEHAIKVCGEDHVGIGTDGGTTGIDDMEKWKKAFADDINRRKAQGVSAPGERPDSFIFAIDMNGPEQFRILAGKLAKRGHPASRIEKVLGGNFLRFAREIWGA